MPAARSCAGSAGERIRLGPMDCPDSLLQTEACPAVDAAGVELHSRDEAVAAGQVRLLYRQAATGLAANVFASVVVIWLLQGVVPDSVLFTWFAISLAVLAASFAPSRR